jgi:hypothetical protein
MSDFFLPQMGDVLTEGVILALFADVLAMESRLSVTDAPGAALGRGRLSYPGCGEMGVKKGGRSFQRTPGSCTLDVSSILLILRRERRATRVAGETRSSGSVGFHQVDILVDVNIACIRSREGYVLASR